MRIVHYNDLDTKLFDYIEYPEADSVKEIIKDVRQRKEDQALIDISARFGEHIDKIELSAEEIEQCYYNVSKETISILKKAIKNVRTFAEKQYECLKELNYKYNGTTLGHKLLPLRRVGAYAPGGRYPLPSSAIMTILPAKVAGVKEVILCSPKIHETTVAAARLSGVDRIFRVGGAQAIAAMAYGTETIPPVNKIVGPGNKYVTMAKKEVYGKCGIDFMAGPSEIMIIADETANVSYLAADMLSQLEHDTEASAILVTTSDKIANQVDKEIYKQLEVLETKEIAAEAINNSIIIIVDSIDQAISIANKKGPEHLQICFHNAEKYTNVFDSYGSLFIGNYSAEVFGDYCSGTNHVLPTNGIAGYSGGLSVFDFIKVQTFQIVSEELAREDLIPTASHIAQIEGLMAHKNAALIRR